MAPFVWEHKTQVRIVQDIKPAGLTAISAFWPQRVWHGEGHVYIGTCKFMHALINIKCMRAPVWECVGMWTSSQLWMLSQLYTLFGETGSLIGLEPTNRLG